MEESFKEECIRLRRDGRSIIEIMKVTGRPKTSIYTHIRHIPLSKERWQEIRKKSGEHIRTFALARKGKSEKEFIPFDIWTSENVLLLGHLLFDGEIVRSNCCYSNRSIALIERIERLMKSIYAYDSKRYTNSITGVIRTCYFNVALGNYLKGKTEQLLQEILNLPLELKREFLRAFFDDEGCMDFRPARNKRRVRGYQKDVRILHIIQSLLSDFDINSRVVLPNEVVITGKDNLLKFQKELNFSPGVRINGNRTNSIWKEPLEKRELLERAIKSYQS